MDSNIAHITPSDLFRTKPWGEDALEWVRLSVYSGMQLFVIFMAAFFFLFLYYFVFGFVVGSVAESDTEDSVIKDEKVPAIKREGEIKRDEATTGAEMSNGNHPAK